MSRRSYAKHRSRRPQGGGKGGIWGLRLKFTTAKTKVHFARPEKKYVDPITGDEEDYLLVTEHFVKSANKGKGGGVRCGPTCVVCAYTNPQEFDLEGVEINEGLAKCDPKDQFVVAGWVEAKYHIVEEAGKRDPSKTFKVRRRCEGQKCQYCKKGLPLVFGNRFYHGFSHTAWSNALFEAGTRAGQMCKCGGYVFAAEYKCSKCDALLYDAAAECETCGGTDISLEIEDGEGDYDAGVWAHCGSCHKQWALCVLDNEALAEKVLNEVRCSECGEVELMEPVDECTEEGCDGDPYDIFDCQLTIKKESEQQTASLVVTDMKLREPDSRLFDPEHQGPDGEKDAETMKTPLDLNDAYKPQTSQEQAQLLGVRDPFAPSAGSNVRSYSKDADD